jgi:hypothetical protein
MCCVRKRLERRAMKSKDIVIPQELINWLRGETIEKRVEESEKGKLAVCIRCNKIFFDKESEEERRLTKCRPAKARHECIQFANYVVLRRGFRNILDAIYYFEGNDPCVEVIRYFHRKSQRRKTWKS